MTEAPHLPHPNGSVDIRPALLRAMVDLYVQKQTHTEQEEQHFIKLALRLIDLVDAKTRIVVASKIAGYPTAPAALRQRLLKELIALNAPDPAYAEVGPLADNAPAPADELSELFFTSSAEERRLILLNLSYAPLAPAKPVAPLRPSCASVSTIWPTLTSTDDRCAYSDCRPMPWSMITQLP